MPKWVCTSEFAEIVLMEFSKLFYPFCLSLFIAKFAAYGFDKMVSSLITDYLENRLRRVKTDLQRYSAMINIRTNFT